MDDSFKRQPYRLRANFDPALREEAIKFTEFLRTIGQKHGLKFRYRIYGSGKLTITVERQQAVQLDTLLQELILSRGIYYYVSALSYSNRTGIVDRVVLPIYQALLEERFSNPYSKHLKRHIFATVSPHEFVPGDLDNTFSKEYEILYQRWNIGLLSDSGFIEELDSLTTRFLLTQIGHEAGTRSPRFDIIMRQANSTGIGMERDFRRVFEKVHRYRTGGLHRLSSAVKKQELAEIATRAFIYFQYFDEFDESQKETHEKLRGKLYKRIVYGDEKWLDSEGEPYKDEKGIPYDEAAMAASRPCHDCAAVKGQYHCFGCDVEQCPRCKGQLLSCDCPIASDYE